jgi:hypothetical protein
MANHKNADLVASALWTGILPSYLRSFFWEAARHNLITYLRNRKVYLTAAYDLADACYYGRFTDADRGKQIFETGFPKTPERLKEKIDLALVETASEVLAYEQMQDNYHASFSRGYFKRGFESAKLLGLIVKDATYDSYFERGKKTSAATEVAIRAYHRSFDEM